MPFVSGMDVDSMSDLSPLSPQDRILQRLAQCGVPEEQLDRLQLGLVDFVQENRGKLGEIVLAILPSQEDIVESLVEHQTEVVEDSSSPNLKDHFRESILWMRWLMFENEPSVSLKNLAEVSVGQRGVCGAVWGQNDIAYRCKTCEHDSTCAICVPCFQNGNHKDHDYSLMYTGGGCCDCGDETAWKREGFCSKHKGAEKIQPLPEEIAYTVGPVLDILLSFWKDKLIYAKDAMENFSGDIVDKTLKVENELTSAVVDMLLEFCKYSEGLLSFVSKAFLSDNILDIVVRAERFLTQPVVKRLHELLLKLLGDPVFKYEFAKVFVNYYPDIIKEAVKECSDNVLENYKLVPTFSVQLFTVPTLTPRLVKEMNLLEIVLGCLELVFISCAGEGHLQVTKWYPLYDTTLRLVEDTRYIMSHNEVANYLIHEHPYIIKTWMRLLSFVQGMNPQKRVTGLHVEEEGEHMHIPFVLGHTISNIHDILVNGAFSVEEMKSNNSLQDLGDSDTLLHHAKVGRLLQQSSVRSSTVRSTTLGGISQGGEENFDNATGVPVPSAVAWLICECLRAMDNWLGLNVASMDPLNSLSQDISSRAARNFSTLKKTLSRIRKAKSISKGHQSSPARGRLGSSSENQSRRGSLPFYGGFGMSCNLDYTLVSTSNMDNPERHSDAGDFSENSVESERVTELEALGVLNLSDWSDIVYDVSSQDISVHIPYHRLLSLLLLKALRKCYGETGMLETSSSGSDCPPVSRPYNDFFGQVLRGCHPLGFSALVMEHPLQIKVFCAQVRAGMWRKNGDVATLSCDWYRSVRLSEQGLELDVFLLQCCAALAPPDLFVKRILERFGLSNYLSLTLEQSNEYEPILMQEMLSLIIQIVKERRFCGLSIAESLRRELIYKLAIGDATRSQLVKSLPQDLAKNGQLQMILDTVAEYSNPSGTKQGKYSLRKTCWEELDLYHPRWTSRDLQVAEERYSRFCKVSALAVQLPRWTKVFYPLNGISRIATSRALLEIVHAVFFYAVFTDKPSQSRAPDFIVRMALHLLSLGLDVCCLQRETCDQASIKKSADTEEDSIPLLAFATEEVYLGTTKGSDAGKPKSLLSLLVSLMRIHKKETFEATHCNLSSLIVNLLKKFAELNVGCMCELQRLAPEVVSHLTHPVPNTDSSTPDSVSSSEEHKLKARERQAAIMEKMKAAQLKFMESLKSEENDDSKSKQPLKSDSANASAAVAPVVCSLCRDPDSTSPLSFLILLQKSRLVSFLERGPLSWEHPSDRKPSSMTASKAVHQFPGTLSGSSLEQLIQYSVNEFSHDASPSEVDAFIDFIKAQLPDARNVKQRSALHATSMSTSSSIQEIEADIYQSVQKDMQRDLKHATIVDDGWIFSTNEDEESTMKTRAESTLLGKYIASLSRQTSEHPQVAKDSPKENTPLKASIRFPALDGFGPTDCDGIYISTCGHVVHQECRNRYLSSLKERYARRIIFEGGHVVDPDQGEFLCPVCRRLANSVLPSFPNQSGEVEKPMIASDPSYIPTIASSSGNDDFRVAQALLLLRSAGSIVGKTGILNAFALRHNKTMHATLEPVFNMLSRMCFPDRYTKLFESGRINHSVVLWNTLKYSLISTEIAARSGMSRLGTGSSSSGPEALYKELDSSSGFMLSLLLQVVQKTRDENSLQVLLRFRGIQLFAKSICYGICADEITPGASYCQGNIPFVLKNADKGVVYPDTQFWTRAADPVLAHDPFSSVMWILFCLPSPFLSSSECLLCLVHLFYAVCVIQAIITYNVNHQFDITEQGFGDCLVSDLCKVVGKSAFAQQHFVSNYIDESSCHLKDIIRRLSYPYLRRCALLWKLLNCSTAAPFGDRSYEKIWLSSNLNNDILESSVGLSAELKEVEEFEKMFHIPGLDVILKDKAIRALSLKWFQHFSRENRTRNYGRNLHCTPVVPFRLMGLPHVYQDLLERYIKQKCPNCGDAQEEPALCLLCGRLCSPTWKPCCRESGCQTHAMSCGAGIGVYLLIRRTTILLQRSARQASWHSPYLDAFGEEDVDMGRGKPLFLNKERYAALTNMVASHGIDRSSEVLRQTTMNAFFMA